MQIISPSLSDQEDYYYTLRDIIFFLENVDAGLTEYRRKVIESKLTAVVMVHLIFTRFRLNLMEIVDRTR